MSIKDDVLMLEQSLAALVLWQR